MSAFPSQLEQMLLDFHALLGAGETQWKQSWLLAQGPGNQESSQTGCIRVDVEGILRCPQRLSCVVDGRGYGQRTLKELVLELQLEFSVSLCLHKKESLSRYQPFMMAVLMCATWKRRP